MKIHTAGIRIHEFSLPGHWHLNLHLSFISAWLRAHYLSLIETIIEYIFVIHIGIATGYIAGKYAGFLYAEHYGQIYSPELINRLWVSPYNFAVYGAITGAIVGLTATLTKRRLSH